MQMIQFYLKVKQLPVCNIVFINNFSYYCHQWHLSVNLTKTKVLVISRMKCKVSCIFQMNNEILEIVNEHSYLGFIINKSGNFHSTIKMLCYKAQKLHSV